MCTLKTIFDPIWATATKFLDAEKIDEKHHFTATPIINPFECPFIYLPIVTNMAKSFLKMIVYLLECIRLSLPLLTLAQISSSFFFFVVLRVTRCHWIFRCFDRNFLLRRTSTSNGRANLCTSNHFPQRFYQIVRNITFYRSNFFLPILRSHFVHPHLLVCCCCCGFPLPCIMYIQFCCWSTSFSNHLIISSSAW